MRGRSSRGRRLAGTGAFVALALLAGLAAAPAALAAPSLVVSPGNGLPGASLKATAREFPPGSVSFSWDGAPLGTAEANAQGRATLSFTIPANATPGVHTVTACSPGCAVQEQDTVTVTAAPTPPPTPTPRPTPRPTAAPTPRTTVPGSTAIVPDPASPSVSAPSVPASPTAIADVSPTPSVTPPTTVPPPASVTQPPPAAPLDSPSAVPVAAGPTSADGSSGLLVPLGVIGALIAAGVAFTWARSRRSASPEPLGAMAAGAAPSAAIGDLAVPTPTPVPAPAAHFESSREQPEAELDWGAIVRARFATSAAPDGPLESAVAALEPEPVAAPSVPSTPAEAATAAGAAGATAAPVSSAASAPAPASLSDPAIDRPPASTPPPRAAPPAPSPWSGGRTISIHVTQIEADDFS